MTIGPETGSVSTPQAPAPQPLPAQRSTERPMAPGFGPPALVNTKKPLYQRWWAVTILLIAAMVLFSFVILALSPQTTGANSTIEPTTPPTTAAPLAGVNVPVLDGQLQFTVTKVDSGDTRVGSARSTATAQGQFVFVHLRITNLGNEPRTLIGEAQSLYDQQGRRFTPDTEAALFLEGSETIFEQIRPSSSVSGTLVFDLPRGAAVKEIELHSSAFSEGVVVAL